MPEQAAKEKRRAFDSLINALKDKNLKVRSAAAKALGLIGDEHAVNPLIDTLRDRNPGFCPAAAEALGQIGDKRAVGPLISSLGYKTRQIPIAATRALGALRSKQAMAPILGTMKDASGDWKYCGTAFKSLNQIDPLFMEKNEKLLRRFQGLFCNQCWRRPVKFEIRRSLFHFNQLVICPECNLPTHLHGGIQHVIGEIGGNHDKARKENMTIWLPIWNEQDKKARYADIDSIWIRSEGVHNYHLAANAVILALTAPADKSQARLKRIPVRTDPGLLLPNTVVNMMKDVFYWSQNDG